MHRSVTTCFVVLCGLFTPPIKAQDVGSEPLRRVIVVYEATASSGSRIVGGHDTTITAHPWQVALVATRVPANAKSQFCGGSIIGTRWVATAAHCVDGGTRSDQIAILAGTESLLDGGVRIPVAPQGIVVNNQYKAKTHDSDIALIHVTSDLGGTPIKGAKSVAEEPTEGQNVTVTGWGARAWDTTIGYNILQEINVAFRSKNTCNLKGSYNGQVDDRMFCAGNTGEDACQRDSGGPATFTAQSGAILVGIVSWGDRCGVPLKYGVYTRVSQFVNWVRDQTNGDVSW